MKPSERAIDAIWKTDMETADEKLLLYHLASKHELGEKHSSSWKDIGPFMEDFSEKWCEKKELGAKTQLSEVKLQRAITALSARGYIETKAKEGKFKSGKKSGKEEVVVAITKKVFDDFQKSL